MCIRDSSVGICAPQPNVNWTKLGINEGIFASAVNGGKCGISAQAVQSGRVPLQRGLADKGKAGVGGSMVKISVGTENWKRGVRTSTSDEKVNCTSSS